MSALHDAWRGWRNRRLADPSFRRRAAAFALTRPIARRSASRLFDLVAGFVYSQVLQACVRLDLFERLYAQRHHAAQLAPDIGLDTDATERLLRAGAALGLFERFDDGRYGLGELGAPMVDNAAVSAMVKHHSALYADLSDPVALLRGESTSRRLASQWAYAGLDHPGGLNDAGVSSYSALMSVSQPLVAQLLLDSHPFERGGRLLDVGGGEGRFLLEAARHAPALELHLFDLPAVATRATRALVAAGLERRATAHGGNFFEDPLPGGMDVVTLIRVVHDHDDAHTLLLLRAAHAALVPGGVLLLAEPMAGTPGARGMGDAYLAFYLLAMGQGESRSAERLAELLRAAGFSSVEECPSDLPLQTRILRARKGSATTAARIV
jgi:demethylspheroidene O-methyltransferase